MPRTVSVRTGFSRGRTLMSDASLHLIALALFAEINARIDCGESRQLVLREKGLTEPEFQQEQQRWLQLLADQAQQQQWQLQQRYSAVYAQWRFRGNAPEPPPQVIRADTLPFGPPAGQPLFTSGTPPAHTPAAAIGANAPFALPTFEAEGKFGAKPYSPTPYSPTPYSSTSRATPPYFASPVAPTPVSPSPAFTSPSPAFTSPASPAVTSPQGPVQLGATRNIPATEAPVPFAPAPRAPAPRWDEPDSGGPSFFTAEELAARRSSVPGHAAPMGQAGQDQYAQDQYAQGQYARDHQYARGQSQWSDKPRTDNSYDPSRYTPAEPAAPQAEAASFFTTAERQVRAADAPRADSPPLGTAPLGSTAAGAAPIGSTSAGAAPLGSPAQPLAEPNPQRPGATGYFTAASHPVAQQTEAPPFFTTSTQPVVSPPPQRSELGRTQAPAFFTSAGQPTAERPGARAAEPERKEPTGFFASAGNTTAFRAEAPPFFTTSTQPVVTPAQQRLDGRAQLPDAQVPVASLASPPVGPAQSSHAQSPPAPVSPAYFTSAGQAAAGRPTAVVPDASQSPSPAYFTSAGQAAAGRPAGQAPEPRKEPTGYFTSVGNTTAFRQEAPPFFTTGTHPVVPVSPPHADDRGSHAAAPLAPRDSAHADTALTQSPAYFTSAGQAAAGRPATSAPDASAAPSPGYFTSAAATGYTPAQPGPAVVPSTAAMPPGTSPVQAFSASGYFTNNPPTGAWNVPQTAAPAPQAPAAMAPPPLSFEQLACLTAEVELNPSKAAGAIAGYGIDQQSYQTQLQALRVRCEADAELQQRYDRLIQYYRSVVKPR